MQIPLSILNGIKNLESQGLERKLKFPFGDIDFLSNDYLGLARNPSPITELSGSTGSRLLSGNSPIHEELEHFCADFFETEAALLFNSGYVANLGILQAVTGRHDLILYDADVHASIKEGIRLSTACKINFRHNDLQNLETKLQQSTKQSYNNKFIVVESLYSMNGDFCLLPGLIELADYYGAYIILDEAHTTGLFGSCGQGLASAYGRSVFLKVHCFGKAVGSLGAVVCGAEVVIRYLRSRAFTFLYSTALPAAIALQTLKHLQRIADMNQERKQLFELSHYFHHQLKSDIRLADEHSPIQPILTSSAEQARKLSATFSEENLDIRPILSPTVPQGKERLRLVLHAYNQSEEVDKVVRILEDFYLV
ncbi:MAG: pyridoxal phosphate-dependent aminotransferase family protein [Bacteroidia bacterium]|nr:pyridoxal phosphate-dependent aminotransferase family protein [Bacteroidia bacterium]